MNLHVTTAMLFVPIRQKHSRLNKFLQVLVNVAARLGGRNRGEMQKNRGGSDITLYLSSSVLLEFSEERKISNYAIFVCRKNY